MTLDILAQKNPFLMTTIGDFNAKSKNWYSQDKTSFEGKTIESITSQFGLYQLINEPTHLLENSSSCIDLIFTSQPNLVVESGVLQEQLNFLINKSKQDFYERMTKKLTNASKNCKAY